MKLIKAMMATGLAVSATAQADRATVGPLLEQAVQSEDVTGVMSCAGSSK